MFKFANNKKLQIYPLFSYFMTTNIFLRFNNQNFESLCVVLGWIIPLCVGLGIEPATFRFQSKALITPLPSLRSSSTFLLSLSLPLSFPLSLCFFLRFSSTCFCFSPRKKTTEKKNESAFIYATLPIIHFLSL